MSNTIQVSVNATGIQGPRGSSHNAAQRQSQTAMSTSAKLMGNTLKSSTSSTMIGMGSRKGMLNNTGSNTRQNSQGPTGSGYTPTN